jgi:hypothetical protein
MHSELSAAPADTFNFHPLATGVPVSTCTQILGVGRSKVYNLLGLGKLRAVKADKRVLVLIDSIREYQRSLPPAKFAPPKPRQPDSLSKLHAQERRRRRRGRAGE